MVNTFLVSANLVENAQFLDNRRLFKQAVEAQQIIKTLTHGGGWANHPATKAWQGYMSGLQAYFNAILTEWRQRGGQTKYTPFELPNNVEFPPWIDHSRIHYSMMAQLIAKDPLYYNMENLKGKITHELLSKFSHLPAEYHNFGYIWPSKHTLIELDTLPLKDLAEPFVKRLICDGHYKNGNPCRNKAIIGNQCKLHQKSGCLPICSAICKTGKQCRNKAKNDSECCGVHKK